MAVHVALALPVRVGIRAVGNAILRPSDVPVGAENYRLRSFRRTGVTVGDYRIRQGWPVATPRFDVRSRAMVSVSGFSQKERPQPLDITPESAIRWIADDDYFDETAGDWTAVQGANYGFRWKSTIEHQPTFRQEVAYYVGKELFRHSAISFDSYRAEHMYANIGAMGGSSGYTVVMAMVLNAAYGNAPQRQKIGLWCPGGAPEAADEWEEGDVGFEASIENGYLGVNVPGIIREEGVRMASFIEAPRIVYVAMAFGSPLSHVYACQGPSNISRKSFYVSEPVDASLNVVLGRTTGSLLHTADMAVFDINVYPDTLGFDDVKNQVSLLSQVYGG